MKNTKDLCTALSAFQKVASAGFMTSFLLLMYFPGLPVNSIPTVLFVIVCVVGWSEVKELLAEHKSVFLLISIALLIGVVFSYKPEKSIKGVYDFIRGAVIFSPALYLMKKYPLRIKSSLIWVGFLCSLLYLGYVLFAIFFVSDELVMQRAYLNENLGYFNTYGTSAALIVFVAISSLLFLQRSPLERLVLVTTSAIGSWLLLFSGSRGSLVAFFAGMSVIVLIRFRKHFVLILPMAVLLFAGLGAAIYFNLAGNYLQAWARGADVSSGRFKMYAATLIDVWQHAKFFGFGVNTFKYLDYGQVLGVKQYAPHSVYVECFFSLGIIGSLFVVAAFFVLIIKAFATCSVSFYSSLGAGLLFFLLTRGLVDMKLFGVYYPGALAIAFAFMLSGKDQPCSDILNT